MKKLLLFLFALMTGVGGAWADGTWNITSADLTTDDWAAMGESTPTGVTALGTYTPYYRTERITLTTAASLEVRFKYTSGSHRLNILGVDILDDSNNVVASDYHYGYTGTAMSANTYLLNAIDAGTYTLRYIINADLSSSAGNITINTIKYADSFANISQWYIVRVHSNQAHYMYYDSENATTGISFTSSTSDINNNNYLWGFVKNGSGVSIYNKAAGSSLAVDNATPSTMSTDGASVSFKLATVAAGTYGWNADAFFSLYQTVGTYLNYQGDKIQRYSSNDEGSNFMIYAVDAPTTLSATLTDVNGATYSVSYTGMAGMTEPPLTGCDGYTLTSKSWSGTSFTATINFPFPISSKSDTNYTYIGQFHNKVNISGRTSADYLWHAETTGVIVHNYDVPTNAQTEGVYTENEKYKWAIYPSISSSGSITFKLKNSSSGYISSTYTGEDSGGHDVGIVTHTATDETATPVIYYNYTGSKYAFKTTTTSRYLSVNSVNGNESQVLGVYQRYHDGVSVSFYTPVDFATLESNLATAVSAYISFKSTHTIGTGLGEYNGDTYSAMETAQTKAQNALSVYTAAQLNADISTLSNPATKLTLNLPTSGMFLRFKGCNSEKYVYYGDYVSSRYPMRSEDSTTPQSIFYFDGTHLLSYSEGRYWGVTGGSGESNWAWTSVGGTGSTIGLTASNTIGKYFVQLTSVEDGYPYVLLYDHGEANNRCDRNKYADISSVTDSHLNWDIEKVTSLPVTITSAHWASLYAPVALTVPEGVTAYWGEDNGDRVTLHAIEAGGIIPDSTGVVLYAETADTYNFAITTGGSIDGENALAGTVATITRTQTESKYDSYILSGGSNGVGFYRDGASTLQGFKSYLPAGESGGSVKTFFFDTETGLEAMDNGQRVMDNGSIYNLAGQKVNGKLSKGLYIVGGKKILVK